MHVGSEELRAGSDVARPFEPCEGLNDRAGVDGDWSLSCVEHDERIEPSRWINFHLRQIADDGDVGT